MFNTTASKVWPLIQDSNKMELWGQAVEKMEVELFPNQTKEGIGYTLKVYAKFGNKRKVWYDEDLDFWIEKALAYNKLETN